MTAAGIRPLPEPDHSQVDALIETLAALGTPVSAGQARTLHTIHEFGLLAGPDGVGRILADSSPAARAARSRQRARAHRAEQEAERRFHASQPHPRQTRAWSLVDGGFRCHLCNTKFLRYVDPAGAVSAAQDHTQQCPGGATDD